MIALWISRCSNLLLLRDLSFWSQEYAWLHWWFAGVFGYINVRVFLLSLVRSVGMLTLASFVYILKNVPLNFHMVVLTISSVLAIILNLIYEPIEIIGLCIWVRPTRLMLLLALHSAAVILRVQIVLSVHWASNISPYRILPKFRLESFLLIFVLHSILLEKLPKARIKFHAITSCSLFILAFLSSRCWPVEYTRRTLICIRDSSPISACSSTCAFLHNITLFEAISFLCWCKSLVRLAIHVNIQICHVLSIVTSQVWVLILVLIVLGLGSSSLNLLAKVERVNALTK